MARSNLSLLALLASLLLIGCGGDSSDDKAQTDMEAPDSSPDLDAPDQPADLAEPDDMEQLDQADDMPPEDMGPAQITLPPEPWDIRARGPYTIGFRTGELTYPAAPAGDARTLKLVVWFPSTQVSGRVVAKYLNVLRRPNIWTDVAPLGGAPLPVLVFSHGNASLGEQSYFMAEHFASHGWLVIAPYHTGNTLSDNEGSINLKSAPLRPQDISATIDWLLERPEGDALHGRPDADKIAMSGHSFGGFTTLAVSGAAFAVDDLLTACQERTIDSRYCTIFSDEASIQLFRDGFLDARIKIAIPQAPAGAEVYGQGLAELRLPTLLFTGAMDRSLRNAEEGDPIWGGLPALGHSVRVDVLKGGHFTFSNMCDLLPTLDLTYDDGCSPDFILPATAYEIINTYSLAFARRYLLDDTSHDDLLDGSRSPWSADISLSTK